jgi:hypothetical protein
MLNPRTRTRLVGGLAALTLAAALFSAGPAAAQSYGTPSAYSQDVDTFEDSEIIEAASDFLGVTAEAAAAAIERVFAEQGRPVGYIAGEEVAGAAGVGLRYGEGWMTLKNGTRQKVYWRGPSIGFDAGGNASRVFTLVYGLRNADAVYRRFPGVEGSAYFVGGVGVNYQAADGITLAPMRAGVGFRAGANIGYLAYSKEKKLLPF